MKKKINLAILMFSTLTVACGVDVTDPQAGYFDDHQDKSGTHTFNNTGSGKMEVNINYNNQSVQPSVVQTVQPTSTSETHATGVLIAGIQFEYSGNYLYGTNLNSAAVMCDVSYRTDVPQTGYLGDSFSGLKPHLNKSLYVGYNAPRCITVTFVSCVDPTVYPYKDISSWNGNHAICKS